MSSILLIETSSKNCSVALSIKGTVVHFVESASEEYIHAEKLHSFIQELLQKEQIALKELDAVCVSKGPGSYTGLRIGVSAAKGFCYALNIPLIALETTQILSSHARSIHPTAIQFLPMIDARRMEVYCALYDINLTIKEAVSAQIVTAEFFQKSNIENTILVGDGVEKSKGFIPFKENMLPCLPSAKMMGELAQRAYDEKRFEDLAYFEPYYLKNFIAGVPKKSVLG